MKSKVVTREEALSRIHDGQTIMFGDWHGEFAADEIIDGMLEKGIKDIDAIAVSAGMADQGVGKLIKDHRVKSLITTHIGLNPIAKDQMFAGELAIEFSPQGTFAERIRCGGAGLGGCLTPTGLGTEVEEGKQKLTIDGKEYLLELPLRADVALIKATKADTAGNISFRMNSRATNSTMAMAADTVIVEVEEIVEAQWRDLGMPETLWHCHVKEFGPLIVSIDTEGRNLFEENKVIFNERKDKAIEEICKHVGFIK